MPELKSEFRKLFTVRSTYLILGFMLVLEVFFAFYATGYKASAVDVQNPGKIASEAIDAITALATFASLVGILLVTHEYRYNTIMYSLTQTKSRSRVLLAKIITVSIFMLVFAAVFGFLSPVLANWGIHLRGLHLVPQVFHPWNIVWNILFYSWGVGMLGLLLAVLIRTQVGAIVAFFLIPSLGEQLLSLLLKDNQIYLPFRSLGEVLNHPGFLSNHAVPVATAYIVGGWVVAWILFLKRDAN